MQAIFEQAMDYMSQGKPDLAQEKLSQILKRVPFDEKSLSLLGHSLLAQNRISDAVENFKLLTRKHPRSESAQVELATAFLAMKNFESAEVALKKAVSLNPKQCEAWLFLGNLAMNKGDRKNAKKSFVKSEENDPFKNQIVEAQSLLKQNDFAAAERKCRQVLSNHKSHPAALYLMAELATQAGAIEEAIKILNQGLKHSPFNVKLLYLLVKSYSGLAHYQQSIEAGKKLILVEPENAAFWIVLAGEYANMGLNRESIEAYNSAIDIAPSMATAHLLLGHVLKISGEREACEKAYHKPIELGEIQGAAYWSLADLKSYQFTDNEILDMSLYVDDMKNNLSQRSQASFALAKSYEDQQDYQLAFKHYQSANELRPGVSFNPNEYQKICQTLIDAYSPKVLAQQATNQHTTTPIFVVGLPRSGSTLIEQILASHSQIEGTMELYNLPNLVRRINILGGQRTGKSYPESITAFNQDELMSLGQSYLDETSIYREGKPFFVDKLPPNFQQIGLIHKILPQAIIIDARRHPLSCGFSAFKQHFASGHGFSYKLENIGAYYNSYLMLMDYWHTKLKDKILTLQYEEMVKDTEQQVKLLLKHCGVEFEEQCLKFYENKRAVRTASSEQVRQPIYTKGTQQWHHFDQYLEPLKLSLGAATLSRFAQWE